MQRKAKESNFTFLSLLHTFPSFSVHGFCARVSVDERVSKKRGQTERERKKLSLSFLFFSFLSLPLFITLLRIDIYKSLVAREGNVIENVEFD